MSYIPTRDALLLAWLANFSTLITAAPAVYGLVAGDAVTIQGENDAFASTYALAVDPSTRSRVTVADKDAAKVHALDIVRPYAQQIKNNLGVAASDKLALGLNADDGTRSDVPPPSTSPLLSIIAATPLQHTLRYADSNTPDKRSKPAGVIALLLFRKIDVAVASDPNACGFLRMATTQPLASDFADADRGKVATYFGRWVNRKGEMGPFSAAVHMVIA